MFSLGLRLLNGWYMAAADGVEKRIAEWPPHPDRVFMALVASLFAGTVRDDEFEALRWLESLPPPDIFASDAHARRAVTSYVPVNDDASPRKRVKKSWRPHQEMQWNVGRNRQPRRFPTIIPHDPVFYLIWPDINAGTNLDAIERLASRVTNVGNAISFVQAWINDKSVQATWKPTETMPADVQLRTTTKGRLDVLIADYRHGRRPNPSNWTGYQKVCREHQTRHNSVFDSNIRILALDVRLPLRMTLGLVAALRSLIISESGESQPEWLTGHGPSGEPAKSTHMALFPLPFVDQYVKHADGHIMGVGISLPRGVDYSEVGRYLGSVFYDSYGQAIRRKLYDGKWFECGIKLDTREHPPSTLNANRWTSSSKCWSTVTPISMGRHFDGPDRRAKTIEHLTQACMDIGLPAPSNVKIQSHSPLYGVLPSADYPPLRRKNGHRMRHTHATFIFEDPVSGPVLVGAGRFRGYGLCKPCQ